MAVLTAAKQVSNAIILVICIFKFYNCYYRHVEVYDVTQCNLRSIGNSLFQTFLIFLQAQWRR
jgi:hypothetical protein